MLSSVMNLLQSLVDVIEVNFLRVIVRVVTVVWVIIFNRASPFRFQTKGIWNVLCLEHFFDQYIVSPVTT